MTAFIEYEKNGNHARGRGRVFVGSDQSQRLNRRFLSESSVTRN